MKDITLSLETHYRHILESFLSVKSEKGLYEAQQMTRRLLESQISPEEIVSIHYSTLEKVYPDMPPEVHDSFEFLLEVMIGYGLAYQEHLTLRDEKKELESQMEVAASMQQTLLPTVVPIIQGLDIGVINIPAYKMSGDYYHFIKDDNNCLGVAIADIIGKGIPAALCMSMIKYAMDSLPEQRMMPRAVLESLNRVVEQNVDDSMFITMMYGSYDPKENQFYYSGAGHEPGFYYEAKTGAMNDLYAKGLVLGLQRKTKYREYCKDVEPGDAIILLSDGVTECRKGGDFIERDEVVEIIRANIHLSAQEIVDNVYHELAKLQEYKLRDDFSLIVIRRVE
ncbi:PP2C family protein-serine/threonine phosphatase [Bacillus sp. FJAT-45350]|uniref:PP2C family protein-serine/threonine phosphatase n=1 Tax=Bacillus sp. FJAT-45350 TaxID=2011014 RepID=UPI000BB6CBC8|nr:PP2C family protein-serine/threonine phosphatase [Bacillus sp. FJAT-45350]